MLVTLPTPDFGPESETENRPTRSRVVYGKDPIGNQLTLGGDVHVGRAMSSGGCCHTGMAYAPVNGLQLYYETHGTGRPLVLLHGGLMTIGLNFGPLLEPLTVGRQVIAVESRATGTPPTPAAR
jgi:hypothetical protein